MKERILEKATEMFLTLGFKSVTMDDLANEMGISKKTIYANFENKTKLIEESTLSLFYTISTGINGICKTEKNPIEELLEIKKFVMSQLKNEKSSPQYQLQKYYPKIYASLKQKQYEAMQDCTINNIKKGIELGIYRKNIDVEFISRIYFLGASSIKDNTLFPSEMFSLKKIQDEYLEYHIRGIVTPEGRKILNKLINSNHE
ncbi:TetR/AcrR family transcriptional regulator [Cellulophaga baltica]|uniref:TetR/AcrR family transcriptional regulator n=1 Tax=Cellulophaga TaxID=104264 RepID=UPI001C07297B|nr:MULTISPECIES: TetR/AcrR family transcriptional regulator [Cellulophaga]MBU2997685.1 TetR/AcrR family transcriptional regulator [Cellulophaga baltica]MDO6769080.1 TetR/AcrR family transcriptional regulator [Cellulophaga sp. 1_MG-2023]